MKKSKALDYELYYGTNPDLMRLAVDQRKNMTEAEKVIWGEIRAKKLGVRFRRQHPIGQFIADFYCHERKLVIEIDGSIHEIDSIKDHDEGRDHEMRQLGIRVLRFTNKEVLSNLFNVLSVLKKELQ
jgi:cyclase